MLEPYNTLATAQSSIVFNADTALLREALSKVHLGSRYMHAKSADEDLYGPLEILMRSYSIH